MKSDNENPVHSNGDEMVPTARRDMIANPKTFGLVWGVPIAGLVVGGVFGIEAYLWPVALTQMGLGCLLNAFRCGRLHCFITGPYFLAGAIVSLVHGTGAVPFGPNGWTWIGAAVLIGGLGLTYLPEVLWEQYVKPSGPKE